MNIGSDQSLTLTSHRSGSWRAQPAPSGRRFLATALMSVVAVSGLSGLPGPRVSAVDASGQPVPRGPGSVSGAPDLPPGFRDTFTDRYVYAGGLRQHVVVGGDGPALLLIHGWPESWYAWRLVMPRLAERFRVVAVDQRGIGLTDRPADGYDTATLANDMAALMSALGYERFSVYGTDVGMPIAYALAADHRSRVDRLIVSEAFIPGVTKSPELFQPPLRNARLWHLMFNQLPAEVNEGLVRGREDIFFGAEFDAGAGTTKLPAETVDYYVQLLRTNRDALRGSFSFYRALITTAQENQVRMLTPLQQPVLAIGGAESSGQSVALIMSQVASNVQSMVVPGGHWVAEQSPVAIVDALIAFLT